MKGLKTIRVTVDMALNPAGITYWAGPRPALHVVEIIGYTISSIPTEPLSPTSLIPVGFCF